MLHEEVVPSSAPEGNGPQQVVLPTPSMPESSDRSIGPDSGKRGNLPGRAAGGDQMDLDDPLGRVVLVGDLRRGTGVLGGPGGRGLA